MEPVFYIHAIATLTSAEKGGAKGYFSSKDIFHPKRGVFLNLRRRQLAPIRA
jgi:hypothetical protein